MGQYVITVIGQGAHGNDGNEADADQMARELVADLKERGHRIFDASFVVIAGEGEHQSLEE